MRLKHYGEIALDLTIAAVAYYFWHWIGFALVALFIVCNYGYQIANYQKTMMNTLLSRLPDRCAMCHREIVDEGGITDDDGQGIYHDACMEKLDAIRSRSQETPGTQS
jgi:hypothetical protein